MKSYLIFIVFTAIVVLSTSSYGQFDPTKIIKKKVEKKAKKEIEKTIDKGLEEGQQNSKDEPGQQNTRSTSK